MGMAYNMAFPKHIDRRTLDFDGMYNLHALHRRGKMGIRHQDLKQVKSKLALNIA